MVQSRETETAPPFGRPVMAQEAPRFVVLDNAVIIIPGADVAQTPVGPEQQAAGGNKPLPPKWFPPSSSFISRMPNGYILHTGGDGARGGT